VVIPRASAANEMFFGRREAKKLSACLGFEHGVVWSRKLGWWGQSRRL